MTHPQTNLQVIRASRKKPLAGDIFAMQLPDGSHLFGRVIDADIQELARAPFQGSYLIYVYDIRSVDKSPVVANLTPDRLLLPPVFINRMPWTRGFFETVSHSDLGKHDLLQQVSFWDQLRGRFVDQAGKVLPHAVEPMGTWLLFSYRWLDDQVSDALGIPRVPLDE